MKPSNSIKKILLISPPWFRLLGGSSPPSPLGLCYIAGVLEEDGFDVRVYNADFKARTGLSQASEMTANYDNYLQTLENINHPLWKEVEAVISLQSPDIVGVTVTTAQYGSALNVSKLVKDFNPDIPIVWGGVHPTILPDEVIKNRHVDIVVRGEGEYTFLDLIQNLEGLDKVQGITYMRNGNVTHNPNRPLINNLDELPFPARHLILGKGDYLPHAFGNIFATRGCPYNCIFCASSKIWTKKIRYRSPENVVNEIKQIRKNFETYLFSFEDDSFTLNKEFVKAVCKLLIEENLDIKWSAETRADLVSDDLIKIMKSAGCEAITIGVESGDEETLKKIKKGITLEQIKLSKKVIKENRIRFSAFFMVGFPWEGEKEINKTILLMKELDPHTAFFSIATPYPGTELYDICSSEGLLPENIDWSRFFHQSLDMCFTRNLTTEEFQKLIQRAEKLFEKHNLRQKRKLLLSDLPYVIETVIKGKYYNPRDLWVLFRRYIWR